MADLFKRGKILPGHKTESVTFTFSKRWDRTLRHLARQEGCSLGHVVKSGLANGLMMQAMHDHEIKEYRAIAKLAREHSLILLSKNPNLDTLKTHKENSWEDHMFHIREMTVKNKESVNLTVRIPKPFAAFIDEYAELHLRTKSFVAFQFIQAGLVFLIMRHESKRPKINEVRQCELVDMIKNPEGFLCHIVQSEPEKKITEPEPMAIVLEVKR